MAKQGGGGEKGDMETNFLVYGIGIVLIAIGIWIVFGPGFSALMGVLRRYELVPFSYFFQHADALRMKLAMLNGGSLDFTNTVAMLSTSGVYVRWLYIGIFPVLGYILLTKSTRGRYQKQHTMATLTKQESKVWPEISPVVGKQDYLMNGDNDSKGEWAVALTEWEFAEKYKLATRADQKVDRDAARAVFIKQLGPRWSGYNALPPHRKALFAVFALRIAGESDEAIARLRTMAKSFAAGGLAGMDTAFADGVVAKHGKHPNLLRAVSQHSYTISILATMLQLSRADGVLASPMFIWLKTVDRGLWYMLNNVGRYAFHVECAGAASHWLFEKTVGQACATPMVEKAIDGLEMGLKEYKEDDALDRLYK